MNVFKSWCSSSNICKRMCVLWEKFKSEIQTVVHWPFWDLFVNMPTTRLHFIKYMQPKFYVTGRFYNTFSSGYLQVVSRELQQAFMWSVIFACLDSGTDILTSHGALSINMLHTKLISHEPIQQKRTYATYNKPKLILINEKEKHFMCIQLMFMCTGGGIKCISFLMCWLHMLS